MYKEDSDATTSETRFLTLCEVEVFGSSQKNNVPAQIAELRVLYHHLPAVFSRAPLPPRAWFSHDNENWEAFDKRLAIGDDVWLGPPVSTSRAHPLERGRKKNRFFRPLCSSGGTALSGRDSIVRPGPTSSSGRYRKKRPHRIFVVRIFVLVVFIPVHGRLVGGGLYKVVIFWARLMEDGMDPQREILCGFSAVDSSRYTFFPGPPVSTRSL